jgi:hypothetical protein
MALQGLIDEFGYGIISTGRPAVLQTPPAVLPMSRLSIQF